MTGSCGLTLPAAGGSRHRSPEPAFSEYFHDARKFLRRRVALVLGAAVSRAASPQKAAAPKPPGNDDCLARHSDAGAARADGGSVAVKPEAFAESIHGMGGLACVDCHADAWRRC